MKNIYTVKPYQVSCKSEWNEFVSNSKNATFLFNREFMDYHNDRFDDFSLMIYDDKKLIALLPANIKDNVLYSHQGLTYGGLLLNGNTKFKVVLKSFESVLKYLYQRDIKTLHIKQIPVIYNKIPSDEVQYLMFLLDAELEKRDQLSVINLNERVKFSKNRLEGCNRANKHGLIIKEEDNFDGFWNEILIKNLDEKHNATPVHSLEEIKLLKSRFPKNIRQFNVYDGNKIVAGTTVFESKNVAHSQYISGNEDKNTLGSLDVLHGHLIENVFAHKTYFDFGVSTENGGKQVNYGLQFWKEGFGARTITQDFYKLKTENFKKLESVLL